MTQNSVPRTQHPPLARTPLHEWHAAHGARFTECDGWQLPACYSSAEREIEAARTGVGLADLSGFAKISLVGSGIADVVADLTGGMSAGKPGEVVVIDITSPVLACRLAEDHLLLLALATNPIRLEKRLAEVSKAKAVVRHDVTTAFAAFALVGPRAEALLVRLAALDISPSGLSPGTCAQSGVAGVYAILVRPPQSNPASILVHVAWDLAEFVWERLVEASHDLDPVCLGTEAAIRATTRL